MDEQELSDLRARYESAIVRNQEARARLKGLTEHMNDRPRSIHVSSRASTRAQSLSAHLESLRLTRRHITLHRFSDYYEKVDQLAADDELFKVIAAWPGKLGNENVAQDDDIAEARNHVNGLFDVSNALTADLGLAVVRARQQLMREQRLLQQAQEDRGGSGERHNRIDDIETVKLVAIEATREQLQSWIEESLAACELDRPQSDAQPTQAREDGISVDDDDSTQIEIEYERYIQVRQRLVYVANALRSSIPSQEHRKQLRPERITPVLQPASQLPTSNTEHRDTGPTLAEIQIDHLPACSHEKLIDTYLNHLKDSTQAQDAELVQLLGLLGHESHLLPTHALLPLIDNRNTSTRYSHQQNEIDHMLSAWAFASYQAGVVLQNTAESQFGAGKEALRRAAARIEEIHLVDKVQKAVLGDK